MGLAAGCPEAIAGAPMKEPVRDSPIRRADPRRLIPVVVAVLGLVLSLACASPRKVNEEMLGFMLAGDHLAAVAVLDEAKDSAYEGKNEFLYYLERGMQLHYAHQYEESNASFHAATQLGEELYAVSISGEVATFMMNDNARPYYGQNFERALVHAFSAFNYQALGQPDEALVEIRQLNDLLRKLAVDGETNTYDDDAFAHYLAGIFFSEQGEEDEAFIAYKKALDSYQGYSAKYGVETPSTLYADAAHTAEKLGFWALDELRQRYGDFESEPVPEDSGQAVILHYNGRAPVKFDVFVDVAFGDGWAYVNQIRVDDESSEDIARASSIVSVIAGGESVRVAFPQYRRIPRAIRRMTVRSEAGGQTPAVLVESVSAIAVRDLADHIVRIRAKAIARAVVKYAIGRAAEEAAKQTSGDYGALAGALIKVTSAVVRGVTEVADKRAWFSVPEEIWLSRMNLPAGDHILEIDYHDSNGAVVSSEEANVTIRPGRRSFVLLRTIQ
jgi:hypothetical protein